MLTKNSTLAIAPSVSNASAVTVTLACAANFVPMAGLVIVTVGRRLAGGVTMRIAGWLVTEPAELLTITEKAPELLVCTLIKAMALVVAPGMSVPLNCH